MSTPTSVPDPAFPLGPPGGPVSVYAQADLPPPPGAPSGSIAELVGSSQYSAIGDDSAKDEDNAAWVMFLPATVRAEWIELIKWVRIIDRMAENEWTEGWGSRFQIFKIGWRTLLVTGHVLPDDYHTKLLSRMQRRWFQGPGGNLDLPSIRAWDEYVEATAEYHRSDMVFETIEEYERMLDHLGGSFFQVFPFLTESQRRAVRAFGMLDQFFNHLRDLKEDTAQQLCYFPTDMLDRFGVDRQEIIDHSCFKNSGYVNMMRFWLDDYLPYLYRRAAEFLTQKNLHFSWKMLRHWFLRRHMRLERALRAHDMDFCRATDSYFAEVKPGLGGWIRDTFNIAGCADLLAAPPPPLPKTALLDSTPATPPVAPGPAIDPSISSAGLLLLGRGGRSPQSAAPPAVGALAGLAGATPAPTAASASVPGSGASVASGASGGPGATAGSAASAELSGSIISSVPPLGHAHRSAASSVVSTPSRASSAATSAASSAASKASAATGPLRRPG